MNLLYFIIQICWCLCSAVGSTATLNEKFVDVSDLMKRNIDPTNKWVFPQSIGLKAGTFIGRVVARKTLSVDVSWVFQIVNVTGPNSLQLERKGMEGAGTVQLFELDEQGNLKINTDLKVFDWNQYQISVLERTVLFC